MGQPVALTRRPGSRSGRRGCPAGRGGRGAGTGRGWDLGDTHQPAWCAHTCRGAPHSARRSLHAPLTTDAFGNCAEQELAELRQADLLCELE